VGCGVVGSILAAYLARTEDVEVWAYDIDRPRLDVIRQHGLHISGAEEFTVHINASSDPHRIPPCDLGIVATKATHTEAAMRQVAHIFGSNSAVCSVQNGIDNEEIIACHANCVIRGVPCFAGRPLAPGHILHEIRGETLLGPYEPRPTMLDTVEHLADLLTRGGMKTHIISNARGAQWTKLIFNSATNAVGAITNLDHTATTNLGVTAALCDDLIAEGKAVARKLDIDLWCDPCELMTAGSRAGCRHKTSMLLDVLARRPTEVDFINGAIVRSGEAAGVPTPLNRALWTLLKGMEHSWSRPD
jgi:2-dehydropantoate 2-reductase